MKRACLAFVIIMAVSALSFAAKKAPDWVAGASKQYPSESFIVGVGVSDSLDSARSAARAEIAKVFKSRIVQMASDTSSEKMSLDGAHAATASLSATETKTNVSTDEILEGVEIAQTWYDVKKKTQYALAVLDKQKVRQLLSRQISDCEESLAQHLADASKAASTVDGIKALSVALQVIDKRDALTARRRVVDPAAIPDLSGTSRTAVEKQRNELLKHIEFVVSADEDENLVSLIGSRITARGFQVLPSATQKTAEAMVITVKGKRTTTAFDRQNPQWKFYNWQAGMDMMDEEGKVIATVIKEGQTAHISEGAADAKAVAEAGDALGAAVEAAIGKYFFGE